jgi:formylmethanofuran dehydrogenase subunit A
MKMYLLITVTILLVSGYVFGSETDSTTNGNASAAAEGTNMSDHVTFSSGKMSSTKGGVTSPMDSETTMSNGTVVEPDGTYKLKDSESVNTLKDGEILNVDGMVTKESKPNGASAR